MPNAMSLTIVPRLGLMTRTRGAGLAPSGVFAGSPVAPLRGSTVDGRVSLNNPRT